MALNTFISIDGTVPEPGLRLQFTCTDNPDEVVDGVQFIADPVDAPGNQDVLWKLVANMEHNPVNIRRTGSVVEVTCTFQDRAHINIAELGDTYRYVVRQALMIAPKPVKLETKDGGLRVNAQAKVTPEMA